jgi:hypothetical protein
MTMMKQSTVFSILFVGAVVVASVDAFCPSPVIRSTTSSTTAIFDGDGTGGTYSFLVFGRVFCRPPQATTY